MALLLNDYRKLARGLTNDTALTDYLNSKNMPHFDNSQEKAKRLLNQYTVGIKKPDKDLHIEGLADFEKQTLTVKNGMEQTEYDFSELDQKYLDDLPSGIDHLPLTATALKILDFQHQDTPDRPILDQTESLSGSRAQQRQAFANEMVFGVNLEKYLKKTGLADSYGAHKDKYSTLIDTSGTQHSFNDGMKDLEHKAQSKSQEIGLRQWNN